MKQDTQALPDMPEILCQKEEELCIDLEENTWLAAELLTKQNHAEGGATDVRT